MSGRRSGWPVLLGLAVLLGLTGSAALATDPTPDPAEIPPDVVDVLVRAREALEARSFRTAADLYQSALGRLGPQHTGPRIGYALAHMALGEDEMALAAVLEGLAWNPGQASLLELLGDLRNRREDVRDALTAWRESHQIEASARVADKIEKAERELSAGGDYDFAASSHFNLRYDGEVDQALASAVAALLEERYWELVSLFDHRPRQPITVVLYPTREFRDVTGTPEWVGGIYDGKIRVPLGGLRRIDGAAEKVLTHELTHAFIHAKSRGACPRWLHEGLAQRVEGRRLSRADTARVRELLAQAVPHEWEKAGFSYEAALSLTAFAESRRGFHSLIDLLEQMGEGHTFEQALDRSLATSYETLCRDWSELVLEQAEQGP